MNRPARMPSTASVMMAPMTPPTAGEMCFLELEEPVFDELSRKAAQKRVGAMHMVHQSSTLASMMLFMASAKSLQGMSVPEGPRPNIGEAWIGGGAGGEAVEEAWAALG